MGNPGNRANLASTTLPRAHLSGLKRFQDRYPNAIYIAGESLPDYRIDLFLSRDSDAAQVVTFIGVLSLTGCLCRVSTVFCTRPHAPSLVVTMCTRQIMKDMALARRRFLQTRQSGSRVLTTACTTSRLSHLDSSIQPMPTAIHGLTARR